MAGYCVVDHCDRLAYAKGHCKSYRQRRVTCDKISNMSKRDPIDRFLEKVDKRGANGCWLWTASVQEQRGGYGQFWSGEKLVRAHVFSYIHHIGPVPDGLQLDHLCRVTRCVNPEHLEPVTSRTNTLRGYGPAAIHASKTHCKHGHLFDEVNTYFRPYGGRDCKACVKNRASRKRKPKVLRTTCKYGHVLTEENTYRHVTRQGYKRRDCRICIRRRVKEWEARKKAKV